MKIKFESKTIEISKTFENKASPSAPKHTTNCGRLCVICPTFKWWSRLPPPLAGLT